MPPENALIAPGILPNVVINPPIPETSFPITIKTGPAAAAIPANFKIVF